MITMVRCSGALALCVALASTAWGGSVPTPAKRPAAAPASTQAQGHASCDRGQFRIVVDVGHTAASPGAVSARGVNEYDFNKRLATRVAHKLRDMGFGRTILLVTDGPSRRGLASRVARANESRADLFLSIHHDSVPDRMEQTWEFEGKKQHYNDQYPGHSIFVSLDNPNYQSSLLFATIVGKELKARGMQYTPHYTDAVMGSRRRLLVDPEAGVYRYDQLIVLRQTHVPAVLLEAGSIINRNEELLLAGSERQAVIAAAVGTAVDRYCQLRPPAQKEDAVARAPQRGRPIAEPVQVSGTPSDDQ
ncbi:MAG: N-acetylmuramoyl-L-alanine amidase [Xanthobacteraceae bacterium]|jgi:N-acetylmuramoyl-L-alanine amidase